MEFEDLDPWHEQYYTIRDSNKKYQSLANFASHAQKRSTDFLVSFFLPLATSALAILKPEALSWLLSVFRIASE
ncbi:hypothetical protein [Meridianimarinicoccus aquatilis]|uniref:Uncharacterized protein n=1 Tax=Meridianimarinicoccus aquatilis TaxID=2552766 RepID=A0A4R6B393_9RHOB|nr:hypothetical protein [Fluviibacterium aquatile]TDL90674.1 hypothetical protein E2L05_03925 [Fluviibacterium aquatile]